MNLKKRTFAYTSIFTPFLAAALLVLIAVSGALITAQTRAETQSAELLLTIAVVSLSVFIFPCIVYYFLRGRNLNTPFLIAPIRLGQTFFITASAFLLITGNLLIKCFYYIGQGSLPAGSGYLVSDSARLAEAPFPAVILAVALVPAICEEIFFRGVVFSEYRVYGTFNAVVFSAVSFAMIHFSISSFPLYLYSGLVLGVTAAATGSVLASAIIHFISNILSIYMSDSFLRVTIQKSGGFFAAFIAGALFLLSLVAVFSGGEGILWKIAKSPKTAEIPVKSAKHFSKVFFSPGFFGLTLIFILITVLK